MQALIDWGEVRNAWRLIWRGAVLILPIPALIAVELFVLPIDTFTFRVWEAALSHPYQHPGGFYPNLSVHKEFEYGDLYRFRSMSRDDAKEVTWHTDQFGRRNRPEVTNRDAYDIVVIGDSNIVGASLDQKDTITEALMRRDDVTAYSYSQAHLDLSLFFSDARIRDKTTGLLVHETKVVNWLSTCSSLCNFVETENGDLDMVDRSQFLSGIYDPNRNLELEKLTSRLNKFSMYHWLKASLKTSFLPPTRNKKDFVTGGEDFELRPGDVVWRSHGGIIYDGSTRHLEKTAFAEIEINAKPDTVAFWKSEEFVATEEDGAFRVVFEARNTLGMTTHPIYIHENKVYWQIGKAALRPYWQTFDIELTSRMGGVLEFQISHSIPSLPIAIRNFRVVGAKSASARSGEAKRTYMFANVHPKRIVPSFQVASLDAAVFDRWGFGRYSAPIDARWSAGMAPLGGTTEPFDRRMFVEGQSENLAASELQLLRSPDFATSDGWHGDYERARSRANGNGVVVGPGISDPSVLTQVFDVVSPRSFEVLARMSSFESASARARVQVNWLDQNYEYLSHSIEIVDVSEDEIRHRSTMSPPTKAAFGRLYVTPDNETDQIRYSEVLIFLADADDIAHRSENLAASELQLLRSPDFATSDGWNGDYERARSRANGNGVVVGPGISDPSVLTQVFDVVSPRSFEVLARMSSFESASARARVQVNWLDQNYEYLSHSIEIVDVSEDEIRHRSTMSPPTKAAFGRLYVTPDNETDQIRYSEVLIFPADAEIAQLSQEVESGVDKQAPPILRPDNLIPLGPPDRGLKDAEIQYYFYKAAKKIDREAEALGLDFILYVMPDPQIYRLMPAVRRLRQEGIKILVYDLSERWGYGVDWGWYWQKTDSHWSEAAVRLTADEILRMWRSDAVSNRPFTERFKTHYAEDFPDERPY